MSAYLVLIFAVLTRLLPRAIHVAGINFTATGGSLLYFGARRPRWQAIFAVAAMAATDFYITVFTYHLPFHLKGYLLTWIWYAAVCLFAHEALRRVTFLRVAGAAIVSATGFFIWVDFAVWAGGHLYPHTLAGLGACYVAAIPFYANDLVSTALTCTALFGVPVLIKRFARTPQPAESSQLS